MPCLAAGLESCRTWHVMARVSRTAVGRVVFAFVSVSWTLGMYLCWLTEVLFTFYTFHTIQYNTCLPSCTSFIPFYLIGSHSQNSLGLYEYFIHYVYMLSSHCIGIASPFTPRKLNCTSQNSMSPLDKGHFTSSSSILFPRQMSLLVQQYRSWYHSTTQTTLKAGQVWAGCALTGRKGGKIGAMVIRGGKAKTKLRVEVGVGKLCLCADYCLEVQRLRLWCLVTSSPSWCMMLCDACFKGIFVCKG